MFLLFDIGATKMRVGISEDGETLGETEIEPTPKDFEEALDLFEKMYEQVTKGKKINSSAGGIRGVLNEKKDALKKDALLPEWVGEPLVQKLSEITGSTVYLENDTAMVGLGETVAGAGRGFKIVAYITISSGVGGVRIINKKIDANSFGFEPGHQIIDADVTICPECTSNLDGKAWGSLESYISGRSFERRFGKKPQDVDDKAVWDEISRLLAYGLNNTIVHWSPDVVVLGGGMMKSPGISVEAVKKHLKEILRIFPELPEIKKAELGDLGGLHGALAYLN